MGSSDLDRITRFEHRFAQAQATEVVDLPWGFAVLQAEFPHSHAHNRIVVTSTTSAADSVSDEIVSAAEEVLGGAGLKHRYVSVDDDLLGETLKPDVVVAGYEHETIVTMIYSGPKPGPPEHDVRMVSRDVLAPAVARDWRIELPDATADEVSQLVGRTALYSRGADVAFLAVFDGADIAARADLYIDPVERMPSLRICSHIRTSADEVMATR